MTEHAPTIEIEAKLALARAPGLHADQIESPELRAGAWQLVGRDVDSLRQLGLSDAAACWLSAPRRSQLQADLEWLQHEALTLLAWGEPDYPPLLATANSAPLLLFVRGSAALLRQPQLAVVGSRHPTASGLRTARTFAEQLARAGLTITSGLALGIDAAAHDGAMIAGHTIAVVGTGLDRVYPEQNRVLHDRIVAGGGAIVSEFPPGTTPQKFNFPRRNRLMSALSLGTLVVEAARQSGSLITARYAGEQGREVFAIPGSIQNPMSRGCHRLIRSGALLVESPEEILQELNIYQPNQSTTSDAAVQVKAGCELPTLDKAGEILLDAIGFEPVGMDDLVARTGMTSQSLASMLLFLELAGKLVVQGGGRYMRVG